MVTDSDVMRVGYRRDETGSEKRALESLVRGLYAVGESFNRIDRVRLDDEYAGWVALRQADSKDSA